MRVRVTGRVAFRLAKRVGYGSDVWRRTSYWVKPRDADCGEVVRTLEEAIALAEVFDEVHDVGSGLGPIDVIELRGKRERLVWSSSDGAVTRRGELFELD